MRAIASSRVISRSSTISTASLRLAFDAAARRPRLQHMQLAVVDGEFDILHVAIMGLEPGGDIAQLRISRRQLHLHRGDAGIAVGMGHAHDRTGDRIKLALAEGQSLPCEFGRYSPKSIFSPVSGLRVSTIPEGGAALRLPKTMACRFSAVPHSTGMPCKAR